MRARNAILPTLTLMGVQFGFLFGGTLLVEIIYSFPGIGNLMVDAVRNADLPVIQTSASPTASWCWRSAWRWMRWCWCSIRACGRA